MIGKRILNYKIDSIIGKGGMGEVFLATHEIINRKVAIKSLLPSLIGHTEIRQRFINEAKVMSQLSHSNIVGLLEYHEDDEGLYLIMEYVDGTPLDELIRDVTGPIGGDTCTHYVRQILEAFDYAHGKGMIHRDIKPSNVMITRDGNVKVLDFGIAKILDSGSSNLTKTGTQMGTVFYMSPEQVEGKEADVRSDIYSLGITINQIATGTNPYKGITTEYEIYNKILKEDLPNPSEVYPGVSEVVSSLILKATSKNPDDRFQSCREMLDVLQSGEIVKVKKTSRKNNRSAGSQTNQSGGKKILKISLIAVACLVVALLVGNYLDVFNFGTKRDVITLFPVKVGEKISYFDSDGKEVIPAQFSSANLFQEGLALVGVGEGDEQRFGYIDISGGYTINPQFIGATNFNNGIAWAVKEKGKITAIDVSGGELFSVDASYAGPYSEGLAVFHPYTPEIGSTDIKYGYLDEKGKIKIQAQYEYAGNFHSGRALIRVKETNQDGVENSKSAFIDKSGKVIGEYFDHAYDFLGDFAIVQRDDKLGAINTKGKIVIPAMYDFLAVDGNRFIFASADEKYGWLDETGKIIIPAQFDMCRPFYDAELAPIRIGDKWGYITSDGKIKINPQFDDAFSFKGETTPVRQSDKIGFIDTEGKYVVAPNLSAIALDLWGHLGTDFEEMYIDENGNNSTTAQTGVYSHYFNAEAFVNFLNLEKPFGFDPKTATFGQLMNESGLNQNEISRMADCYSHESFYGNVFITNYDFCGNPWQVRDVYVPRTFLGVYIGNDVVSSSYFDADSKVEFRYSITFTENSDENTKSLETAMQKILTSNGYASSLENTYTKNGVNVSFVESQGDSDCLIWVWRD